MRRLRHLATLVSGKYHWSTKIVKTNKLFAVTHVLFETGDEKLRLLEQKVYVASGRFIVEAGKPSVVEYLISEVAASG